MASLQVATDIVSTISTLENDLQGIAQAQTNLLSVIAKAQASMISDEELSGIKSNMDKVVVYNTKLMSLKATMSMLTGRSKQLKDRAARLQELKMKYLSEIDDIRKLERKKDQSIAAKTSTSTPTRTPSPATPSSPSSTALPPSPAIPAATCSSTATTTIPKLVRKKKKAKARQALIDDGDGDDGRSWAPKKSLSQQHLALKKK